MRRATLILTVALLAACAPTAATTSITTGTTQPVRIPLGPVTGIPTGSADEMLGTLILGWLAELRHFATFSELPPPPAGATVADTIEIGRGHNADVGASLSRLEQGIEEMGTFVGRDDLSADSEDVQLLIDEAAAFVAHQRTQNDTAIACFETIPEVLYPRQGEEIWEVPEFTVCLLEVIAGSANAPDEVKLRNALTTVYDDIIAGDP